VLANNSVKNVSVMQQFFPVFIIQKYKLSNNKHRLYCI